MELTPAIQALIEAYIAGRLRGEALQAFEQRLAEDELFAQEVAFQQELNIFLADTPENDLRKNLERLNKEVVLPKDKGGNWKIGLSLLLPFFFLGTWWVYNQGGISIPIESPTTKPDSLTIDTLIYASTDPVLNPNGPLAAPPPAENLTFEPNPVLVELIEKNKTNDLFKVKTTNWPATFELTTPTDSLTFRYTTTLTSTQNLEKERLQIHLFSNEVAEYEAFQPIATNILALQKIDDTTYQLTFQETYLLAPGRYYFVIQDVEQRTTYFVEQFLVNLKD